jgi:hypothetical protein
MPDRSREIINKEYQHYISGIQGRPSLAEVGKKQQCVWKRPKDPSKLSF